MFYSCKTAAHSSCMLQLYHSNDLAIMRAYSVHSALLMASHRAKDHRAIIMLLNQIADVPTLQLMRSLCPCNHQDAQPPAGAFPIKKVNPHSDPLNQKVMWLVKLVTLVQGLHSLSS